MYYKRITVCRAVSVEYHETYSTLKQFDPILSARFGIIYLAVKGFRSGEGKRAWDRLSVFRLFVCLLSRASLAVLSFPRIPSYPGTQIKKKTTNTSFGQHQFLCDRFCICISRGWSVFNFPSACKADSESEKVMNFVPWDWYACIRANRIACSSAV